MGWSSHHKNGLIYYNPQNSYRGYTLVATNRGGCYANLIDMEGRICHRWYHPEEIVYGYLLPNGHLLFRSRTARDASEGPQFGGRSLSLIELDWDSNVVWQYRSPDMFHHHDFERLLTGNTLNLLWAPVPADLSAQVKGGFVADDDPEEIWGDVVQEITPDGEVVYEWRSWEFLDVEEDVICPLEGRKEWSHQNALNITPEGDLLVSYRQTSTVGIVDKASGQFRWKWGPGDVYHQHHPTWLPNGRVMIFDNGSHRRGASRSRIIEVDPETNEIGWEYTGRPDISFFSYNISSAERQPNGNTVICEGAPGRIFEVTQAGEIVWEYVSPFYGEGPGGPPQNGVFRAHRYGPDHPALIGKDLDPGLYGNLNRMYGSA